MRTSLNQGGFRPSGIKKAEGSSSDPKTYTRSVNNARVPAGKDDRTPVNYIKPSSNNSKSTEAFKSSAYTGQETNQPSRFSSHKRVQVGQRK